MLKSITICILVIVDITYSDGNVWIKDEDQINTDSVLIETSSIDYLSSTTAQVDEVKPSEASQSTIGHQTQSTPTESSAITTEKPPAKDSGCGTRLWTGGKKYCWTRCDSSSTSSFWSTWCFTTNATSEEGDFVDCDSDEICSPEWKCKSSCGMFSPHWDRDASKLEEPIKEFDSYKQ